MLLIHLVACTCFHVSLTVAVLYGRGRELAWESRGGREAGRERERERGRWFSLAARGPAEASKDHAGEKPPRN